MRHSLHSQWIRLMRVGLACLLASVLALSFSLHDAAGQRRGSFGGGGSFGRSSGGFGGGSFGSGGGGSFGRSSGGFGSGSGGGSFGRSGSGFGSSSSGSFGRSSGGGSFGRSGGFGGSSYTRSYGGGSGYYGGRTAYGYGSPSYYWGSPRWYYYTPFFPAFYYNAPYQGADGMYYPGGFNFLHFLISLALFIGVIMLIGKLFFGRKNVRYTTY